jgi:NAD(P)H-nitrite reductase large subunit
VACTLPPAEGRIDEAPPRPRFGQAMTRCECAGMSFAEIAQRLSTECLSLEEVTHRTGCGTTCTACLPDLRDYLARE